MSRTKIEQWQAYKTLWLLVRAATAGFLVIFWYIYNIFFIVGADIPEYEGGSFDYYRAHVIQRDSLFNIVWGILVLIAGILIFYFCFGWLGRIQSEKKIKNIIIIGWLGLFLIIIMCIASFAYYFYGAADTPPNPFFDILAGIINLLDYLLTKVQLYIFNILYFLGIYHYAD